MNIGIIGLGLIGGSMAKAVKTHTEHTVYGCDKIESIQLRAKMVEAIDDLLTPALLKKCDIILIALFPDAAIEWLKENASKIRRDAMVFDCCGNKRQVCEAGFELAEKYGFTFIGGHPMAGIASMVLVPKSGTTIETMAAAKAFFLSLGFGRITITTAQEHDRVIAYTSQLAHVLSSAYIKSDTAMSHTGISAGSFRDMTRVATLQPEMWAELCLENRQPMLNELNGLIDRLGQYRDAIQQNDYEKLRQLLHEGSQRKAEVDKLKA